MSGYSIRLTAFLPTGKDAEAHMAAFHKFREAVIYLAGLGFAEIELHNEFKPHRKSPASQPAVPAEPAMQEGAGAEQAPQPAAPVASLLPNGNPELGLVNDKRPKREEWPA